MCLHQGHTVLILFTIYLNILWCLSKHFFKWTYTVLSHPDFKRMAA